MRGISCFAFAVAAQVLTWCETRTWWRSAETMLLLAILIAFLRHQLRHCRAADAGEMSHRLYRAEDEWNVWRWSPACWLLFRRLTLPPSDASGGGRPCVMTVLTVGTVLYREIATHFWYGDFFPDVLCLSSYCAGRSGCVTRMMLALILLINKQHNAV